ncbi:MAG: hypothetical protein LQ342_003196 [Letrouitia transgressa]|nr:MAG: hypothetical protein LQ342_003196 [Letrouitia transgressa]
MDLDTAIGYPNDMVANNGSDFLDLTEADFDWINWPEDNPKSAEKTSSLEKHLEGPPIDSDLSRLFSQPAEVSDIPVANGRVANNQAIESQGLCSDIFTSDAFQIVNDVPLSSYPNPEDCLSPKNPYFGDVEGRNNIDASNDMTNIGALLEELKSSADVHQMNLAPQDLSTNNPWNAKPSLDQIRSPSVASEASPRLKTRKPPVPIHSKPVIGSIGGLDQRSARLCSVSSKINSVDKAFLSQLMRAPTASVFPGKYPNLSIDGSAVWQTLEQIDGNPRTSRLRTLRSRNQKKKYASSDNDGSESDPGVSYVEPTSHKKQRLNSDTGEIAKRVHRTPYQKFPAYHSKKNVNPRTALIHAFAPSTVYAPLPPSLILPDWDVFKYTSTGELEPNRFYTPAEICRYLFQHPLRPADPLQTNIKRTSALRLWIQRNPSDSARRYPTRLSNRCRFANCLATLHVINQGHLRVCFDEVSARTQTANHDPFLSAAGYVHLNCLERFLPFPLVCALLPISPDTRILPCEPRATNRMTPSPASLVSIAEKFVRCCEKGTLKGYPGAARPHKGSLTWRLMQEKVKVEGGTLKGQVERRGGVKGSLLVRHLGDLEVEKRTRDRTRRPEWQCWGKKKRWAEKDEDEDDVDDDDDGEEEGDGKEKE